MVKFELPQQQQERVKDFFQIEGTANEINLRPRLAEHPTPLPIRLLLLFHPP